jgi:hypothetical protein
VTGTNICRLAYHLANKQKYNLEKHLILKKQRFNNYQDKKGAIKIKIKKPAIIIIVIKQKLTYS